MEKKLGIKDWAEDDRPREKLLRSGVGSLSNAELLAILIGSGTTKMTAVELMQEVLAESNNNLNTLGKKTLYELMQHKGIGEAKAMTILAACELGKRRAASQVEERTTLSSADDIYALMHPKMQDLDVEEGWVLLLNRSCKLIEAKCISHGGLTETAVDVRIIVKEAIMKNATVIAFCHNHPSNNRRPSTQDDHLTQQIKKACELMRIHFLDHVIITDGGYYSYHDHGQV